MKARIKSLFTKTVVFFVISLLGLSLAACSGGGSSSGGGSGQGYIVTLTATDTSVPQTGQTILIADVKGPDGAPVPNGEVVAFSSSLGGTFKDGSGETTIKTVGGRATAIYTATDKMTGNDRITASYKGAYAYVYINVYKP